MPDSSFFQPMQIGGGAPTGVGPSPFPDFNQAGPPKLNYQTLQNLRFKGGYKNQYGTDIGGSYTPDSGTAEAHANFPIGAYEHGLNVGLSGFMRPAGPAGTSDYGGMLSIGKVNRAQVNTADVLKDLDPQTRALLEANPNALEAIRRKQLDAANQIGLPGTPKYNFELGVDTNARRSLTPQSAQDLQNYNESQFPGAGFPGMSGPGMTGVPGINDSGTMGQQQRRPPFAGQIFGL